MGVQMGLGLSTPKLEYMPWRNEYSLTFDGANDHATITDVAEEIDISKGTISCWVKFDATSINGSIFKASVDANNNIALTYINSSTKLTFQYKAAGTATKVDHSLAGVEGNDTWYHIAITWNVASDEVKAYVNGSQTGTTQSSLGTFSGTIDAVVVAKNSLANNSYFSGHIDNLSIFDVTKSDDEITTIYNAGKPKDMTQGFAGLIAYYVMNEGSGTTVSDDSTNNNDMTLVHAPAWTTDVP